MWAKISDELEKEVFMTGILLGIAVLLLILWVLGLIFKIAGALIHLLLVIAVVAIIISLIRAAMRRA
jgi:hypothetical protein